MWVRGLKLQRVSLLVLTQLVAPRVGAWIETSFKVYPSILNNVAPRVGAWIETSLDNALKVISVSHPVWVRGLKRAMSDELSPTNPSRTPCGCVD